MSGATRPDPHSLRAVTVALDPDPGLDPVAVAGTTGSLFAGPDLTLAGRGRAAILELPGGLGDGPALDGAIEWLAAVPHRGESGFAGARVTAHGALPFDRDRPASLIVPEVTYGRDHHGRCWATVIGPPGGPEPRPEELRAELGTLADIDAGPGPRTARHLVARPAPAGYAEAVAQALDALAAGPLRKVVLARCLDAEFDSPVSVADVLRRLMAQEPSCTAFAHDVVGGRFLGVTPELLVARTGREVTCHPLAGTIGLGRPGDEESIVSFVNSTKDRREHEMVVDEIARALRPLSVRLEVPGAPTLVRLHSVAHLGTQVRATLGQVDGRRDHVLALLAALHPTPAVGGVPVDLALERIRRSEVVPRDHWAGPVGWVDAGGDGHWMIGIRSTTVADGGLSARLVAGAGVVAGSDPAAELAETTVKLVPVLQALAPDTAPEAAQ